MASHDAFIFRLAKTTRKSIWMAFTSTLGWMAAAVSHIAPLPMWWCLVLPLNGRRQIYIIQPSLRKWPFWLLLFSVPLEARILTVAHQLCTAVAVVDAASSAQRSKWSQFSSPRAMTGLGAPMGVMGARGIHSGSMDCNSTSQPSKWNRPSCWGFTVFYEGMRSWVTAECMYRHGVWTEPTDDIALFLFVSVRLSIGMCRPKKGVSANESRNHRIPKASENNNKIP